MRRKRVSSDVVRLHQGRVKKITQLSILRAGSRRDSPSPDERLWRDGNDLIKIAASFRGPIKNYHGSRDLRHAADLTFLTRIFFVEDVASLRIDNHVRFGSADHASICSKCNERRENETITLQRNHGGTLCARSSFATANAISRWHFAVTIIVTRRRHARRSGTDPRSA